MILTHQFINMWLIRTFDKILSVIKNCGKKVLVFCLMIYNLITPFIPSPFHNVYASYLFKAGGKFDTFSSLENEVLKNLNNYH
jgi:hypothetical protein